MTLTELSCAFGEAWAVACGQGNAPATRGGRRVPRDTPLPSRDRPGRWSKPPPYTRPQHVARSFSNFSPAGAGPAGVVGRDQGYGFNVLANRKPITLPRRSEVPPTRLAARRNCGLKPEDE